MIGRLRSRRSQRAESGRHPPTSKANPTDSNKVEKKKAPKKPKVSGKQKTTEKTSSKPPNAAIPIMHFKARPPHANKTTKAHAISSKEVERKELGW